MGSPRAKGGFAETRSNKWKRQSVLFGDGEA
jgi:hypothetical protein